MNRANPPNNNVPSVEYDHRARDARLRLERVERLFAGSVRRGTSSVLAAASVGFSGCERPQWRREHGVVERSATL